MSNNLNEDSNDRIEDSDIVMDDTTRYIHEGIEKLKKVLALGVTGTQRDSINGFLESMNINSSFANSTENKDFGAEKSNIFSIIIYM
ncbi:hypothetical protein DAPK24_040130 [Pichia kluyveri]|uniref:Uncharacterized protein n=1 Tax=Pichia kluyveri TaxID=36015 RepID=A0AAV5R884_PICKL|nr:hypothetical protein DAPK24_040130 [Pichia kluyveri]